MKVDEIRFGENPIRGTLFCLMVIYMYVHMQQQVSVCCLTFTAKA